MDNADIWSQTYRNDPLINLREVSVLSALHGDRRRLIARINIDTRAGSEAVRSELQVNLTPTQMRELAGLLNQHADRIEHDLIPLLDPEPALISFTLEPVEPVAEAA